MNIFIAIPCYGGMLHADFTKSLLKLVIVLLENKIPHSIEFLQSESLISRGRNTLVAKFLASHESTDLLFLDSDIVFDPNAIITMINSKKELIGCPYPKKMYNWDKVEKILNDEELSGKQRLELSTDINYNLLPTIHTQDNRILCKDIPTGMMLIRRCVFTALILAYKDRKYINNIAGMDECSDYFYDFFATGVVDNVYLSEDYYFCYLCRSLDIECWLESGFSVGHIGKETFYGNLASQLNYYKNDNLNLDKNIKIK